MNATIHHGDCLDVLRQMPDNSVHAIVTDPPYGLANTTPEQVADTIVRWVNGERDYLPAGKGFMGKEWDGFVPPVAVWDEAMRVLKPGGHVLAFAGTRTMDLMTLGLRLAGADIRDSVYWHYGSGMPKSHNLKGEWSGWGTALKPATEPIVMARKPFRGTVAANVLEHGTGAINVDACRVATTDDLAKKYPNGPGGNTFGGGEMKLTTQWEQPSGRWPANVILDEHMAGVLDEQSGDIKGVVGGMKQTGGNVTFTVGEEVNRKKFTPSAERIHDSGGASRFFKVAESDERGAISPYFPRDFDPPFMYAAKAPKKERPDVDGVKHPTVKPVSIMKWLVRLVTPPNGIVLDPFAGSGTTIEAAMLEGFDCIGIEREAEYLPLIHERIRRATEQLATEDPEQGSFSFEETA